jgi:hypothetical protein
MPLRTPKFEGTFGKRKSTTLILNREDKGEGQRAEKLTQELRGPSYLTT